MRCGCPVAAKIGQNSKKLYSSACCTDTDPPGGDRLAGAFGLFHRRAARWLRGEVEAQAAWLPASVRYR